MPAGKVSVIVSVSLWNDGSGSIIRTSSDIAEEEGVAMCLVIARVLLMAEPVPERMDILDSESMAFTGRDDQQVTLGPKFKARPTMLD